MSFRRENLDFYRNTIGILIKFTIICGTLIYQDRDTSSHVLFMFYVISHDPNFNTTHCNIYGTLIYQDRDISIHVLCMFYVISHDPTVQYHVS